MSPISKFVVVLLMAVAASSQSETDRQSRQFYLFPSASGQQSERYYPQPSPYYYPSFNPAFSAQPIDYDASSIGNLKASERFLFGLLPGPNILNGLFNRPSTPVCPTCPAPVTCPAPLAAYPSPNLFTTCTSNGITTATQGSIVLTGLANPSTCEFTLMAVPARQYNIICTSGTLGAGGVTVGTLPSFTPTTAVGTAGVTVTTSASAATLIVINNQAAVGAASCTWQAI